MCNVRYRPSEQKTKLARWFICKNPKCPVGRFKSVSKLLAKCPACDKMSATRIALCTVCGNGFKTDKRNDNICNVCKRKEKAV